MYSRILVATDGSETSDLAVEQAVTLKQGTHRLQRDSQHRARGGAEILLPILCKRRRRRTRE